MKFNFNGILITFDHSSLHNSVTYIIWQSQSLEMYFWKIQNHILSSELNCIIVFFCGIHGGISNAKYQFAPFDIDNELGHNDNLNPSLFACYFVGSCKTWSLTLVLAKSRRLFHVQISFSSGFTSWGSQSELNFHSPHSSIH